MVFCSRCGNKLNESDLFCSGCGNKISSLGTEKSNEPAKKTIPPLNEEKTNKNYDVNEGESSSFKKILNPKILKYAVYSILGVSLLLLSLIFMSTLSRGVGDYELQIKLMQFIPYIFLPLIIFSIILCITWAIMSKKRLKPILLACGLLFLILVSFFIIALFSMPSTPIDTCGVPDGTGTACKSYREISNFRCDEYALFGLGKCIKCSCRMAGIGITSGFA